MLRENQAELTSNPYAGNRLNQALSILNRCKTKIRSLKHKCSQNLILPQVTGSQLQQIQIPRIYVTSRSPPGFYVTLDIIEDHIKSNPAHGNYYFSMFRGDLVKSEPNAFARIAQRKNIRTLDKLFNNLATNYAKPMVIEITMTEVLESLKRMSNQQKD